MKGFSSFLVLMTVVFSASIFACAEDGSSGFLPKNSMKIPANIKRAGGLSEAQFNKVIDKLERIYKPVVRFEGATLNIVRNWTDPTVNASASREGSVWRVDMFGGLARHEAITEDGFSLVLCHEIGHHIGGAPIKMGRGWPANEGQSDYFAALKCLRRLFLNDNNERAISKMELPVELVNKCKAVWESSAERTLCIRTAMAGDSVAKLFTIMGGEKPAQFSTPDPRKVSRTDDMHPDTQCRLDTFFQGSLCKADLDVDFTSSEEVTGSCHGVLGNRIGLRPNCWFKPSVQ